MFKRIREHLKWKRALKIKKSYHFSKLTETKKLKAQRLQELRKLEDMLNFNSFTSITTRVYSKHKYITHKEAREESLRILTTEIRKLQAQVQSIERAIKIYRDMIRMG